MKVSIKYKKKEDKIKTKISISKRDLWDLDYTLAQIIHPALVKFRKLHAGYPGSLTPEKWEEILDEMIYAFSLYLDETRDFPWAYSKEELDRQAKGLALFAEWYGSLWI